MNERMIQLMKIELSLRAMEAGLLTMRHTTDDMYSALSDADYPWFDDALRTLARQVKDFHMDECDLETACE